MQSIILIVVICILLYLFYLYTRNSIILANNSNINNHDSNKTYNTDNSLIRTSANDNEHMNNNEDKSLSISDKDKSLSILDRVKSLSILDKVFDEYDNIHNREHIFFDIMIGNKFIGQVIIELFNDIVPKTVDNFIYMTMNKYKGSCFHRIIKNFIIQGGDFINGDGTGTSSIYGNTFEDENFILKHDEKYLLSMANSGSNTNGCQFFITLDKQPSLDNKHVVFGKVIEGFTIIDYISDVITDVNNKPYTECMICNCGLKKLNN